MHQLNNGLTLVLLPSTLAPVVAVQAWVSVGSADETHKQAGLSHVMEHLLFKGTARRGVGEIARNVESAGGEINAWTSRDDTVFHVVMPSRYIDVGIDVLADALQFSTFDSSELDREREVILEEIRQGEDEPTRVLAQNMFSGAFSQHPYRLPVIGTAQSVSGFSRTDLLSFHQRWYRASNITLVVSGDFDTKKMKSSISRRFSSLPTGPRPRRNRARESLAKHSSAFLDTASLVHSQVTLSFKAPPVTHNDCAPLDLFSVIMGQGESSLLSSHLVRERELCRGAYAYVHALRDHSLVVLGVSAESEKLPDTLPILGELLESMRSELVSTADLEKAKHAVAAESLYSRQTAEGSGQSVGSYLSLSGDSNFEGSYLKRIASLTAEDLRSAAQRVLDDASMNLSALVPESAALARKGAKQAAANRMMALVRKGARASSTARRTRKKPKNRVSKKKAILVAQPGPTIIREQLDNGMTIIIQHDASVPLVAARAIWSGGVLRETKGNAGISAVMASTITRGCGRLSAEEIIEEVDVKAASLAGFSGRNSFGLQAEWFAKDWRSGIDLLSECILSPHFSEDEIERSKRKQISAIKAQMESPSHQVFRLFQETLFKSHPYRRNALGSQASSEKLTASTVRRHYRRHYPISALSLAIVGDVPPDKLLARLKSRFSGESARLRPDRLGSTDIFVTRPSVIREVYQFMDRAQAHLVVGFPGITMNDPDRYALELLISILGGQGGRLFLELRDKQSLAYQVGAYSLEGIDPGYVAIYLSCAPEKVETAVASVRAQIDALLRSGVLSDELQRAGRYLIGSHDIALQRRSAVAAVLAFHSAYGIGAQEHLNYARRIEAVRPKDLMRVARRIFDWDLAVTATVTPKLASPKASRRMRGVVRKTKRPRRPKRGSERQVSYTDRH